MKAEWKFYMLEYGALFVMTSLIWQVQMLSVDNLVTLVHCEWQTFWNSAKALAKFGLMMFDVQEMKLHWSSVLLVQLEVIIVSTLKMLEWNVYVSINL